MGELQIYQNEDGSLQLNVQLQDETLWLSQAQMAQLFATKRPAITKHLSNIFKSGELEQQTVCSILEHTAADGKTYRTQFYNLDAIISVGYRVNSISATIWSRAARWFGQYLGQLAANGIW